MAYLLFQCVEIVNDHTDEQVQGEERTAYDENDEVDRSVLVVVPLRLHVQPTAVHRVLHDV
jgi:hypothetical protein